MISSYLYLKFFNTKLGKIDLLDLTNSITILRARQSTSSDRLFQFESRAEVILKMLNFLRQKSHVLDYFFPK